MAIGYHDNSRFFYKYESQDNYRAKKILEQ